MGTATHSGSSGDGGDGGGCGSGGDGGGRGGGCGGGSGSGSSGGRGNETWRAHAIASISPSLKMLSWSTPIHANHAKHAKCRKSEMRHKPASHVGGKGIP
jgi:hypothetical protein